LRTFDPFFKNPHLATIAGNFWKRPQSELQWPVEPVTYKTEPDVQVRVEMQFPSGQPRAEVILVHGLEGSSQSGYICSMAQASLERGFTVHRFNMRGCGGTEELSLLSYHAGQTSDLLFVAKERRRISGLPIFIVGYSLGANVTLKLAGELGGQAEPLLAAVCAVSAPIDLSVCAHAIGSPVNFIYENRFVARLKDRIRRKNALAPDVYTLQHLPRVKSIVDFDDHYTAKLFGFGTAENYFRTQSSNQFLERIRVPTLLITAKDDPLVPFRVYDHPAFAGNTSLRLEAIDHGGHLGFISRTAPRFWLDDAVLGWMEQHLT
jgi:predicted alpha/beta-fold hydrolase